MRRLLIIAASAALMIASGAQAQQDPSLVAAGQRIAEANCGGCHAVGSGRSPEPRAPAFSTLHRRYPAGGLAQILEEGMIAPLERPDEGPVLLHPSMPMAVLGPDQIAALTAYLRSLEPAPSRSPLGR